MVQWQLKSTLYIYRLCYYLKKMLGCFNPVLGQIWTNPAVGLNVFIAFF